MELYEEADRICFIMKRDGMEAAHTFVRQTYKIYKAALFHSRKHGFYPPHHATLPEYRLGFIRSCLYFRSILRRIEK